MLVDYHMHLRPDESAATAEAHFTEANVLRYVDVARSRGVAEIGVTEHIHRFREALSLWDHEFWLENAHDDLGEYCRFLCGMRDLGLPVRAGIEVDWVGSEGLEQTTAILDGHDWDFVVGSVHFLDRDALDHPDYDIWESRTADEIWTAYFSSLGHAAASGIFDVMAHPDLVKIWGSSRPDPPRPRREYYELALDGLEAGRVAIEVSSAGLRKPVGEIYPDAELLRLCRDRDMRVTLASDAHRPEDVAFEFGRLRDFLRAHGIDRIVRFDRREGHEVSLG